MNEQKRIKELGDREAAEGYFVVEYKHEIKEYKKGFRFMFGISDDSGEVMVNYWGGQDSGEVEDVWRGIKKGDVVYIKAESIIYNEKLQININPPQHSVKRAEEGDYDPGMFIAVTTKDIAEMEKKFFSFIDSVRDPLMNGLLLDIFKDSEFWNTFKHTPAAKQFHHAYIGGLLEHTLGVATFVDTACKIQPAIDRDLAITGALLHDIGKTQEIKTKSTIEYTPIGMLEGHISIGYEMIKGRVKDFPETLSIKLLHIILSHHGEKSKGSPQEPMFPEAAAVYLADAFDSLMVQFIKEKEDSDTDDFKIFSRLLNRRIFVK